MKFLIAPAIATIAIACGANSGTRPQDMSAAQHEAMAEQEEQTAAGHEAQYEPAASTVENRCGGKVCWTSRANPTAQHLSEAENHRELAAKHRAASESLRQAEAQACVGIDPDDRDMSPFAHREDIQSVSVLKELPAQPSIKGAVPREVGATVVFRAVPGMTAEWLQRVVDCHIARAAAAGYQMPEMSYCPLTLKGVTAKVTSVGDGFAVNIKAQDPGTVNLVIARAQALASTPGPVPPAEPQP